MREIPLRMETLSPPLQTAFVKASTIAKFYNVTPSAIFRWAKAKKIPSVSFEGTVRFDIEAVRAVIEGVAK